VGKTIRVVVYAENDYSFDTATSSQTGVVGVPPANTSLPTVSGLVIQGQTLNASSGAWSGSPTYAYQWRRCDSYGGNCTDIASATSNSYVLVSGDVGMTVRVVVTATSSYGSASATSERTGLVSATAGTSVPVNNTPPTISGDAVRDLTLTASDGTWSNSPTSYTYQWLRCNSAGASCVNITSATSSSYVLVLADVNSTIRIVVTATNSYPGSPSATSAKTAVVVAPSTTSVSAGSRHTCALISTGAVKCWGDNYYGELGNNTTIDSSTPVIVSGIDGTTAKATAVSAGGYSTDSGGGYYSCALLSSGAVKCWGNNANGQLGDGTTTDSSIPVAVSGIDGVTVKATAISTGSYHSCALLSSGAVKCWGANSGGQLGNNTTTSSSTPVAVSGIDGVTAKATAISAGGYHSCALLSSGAVKCWGYNDDGELGNNTTIDSSTPVAVSGIDGATVKATAISAGEYHSCVVLDTGAVKCWGNNDGGELGNNTTTNSSTPVAVSGIDGATAKATAISAGGYDSCAVLDTGAVKCWGDNYSGQLGDGATTGSSIPVAVSGIDGVTATATAIDVGEDDSCTVLDTGAVKCWGANYSGQLGDGSTDDSSTPVSVTGLP
jgi:alpha-tubulin suppressor-like RCC1 family protein